MLVFLRFYIPDALEFTNIDYEEGGATREKFAEKSYHRDELVHGITLPRVQTERPDNFFNSIYGTVFPTKLIESIHETILRKQPAPPALLPVVSFCPQ